MSVEGNDVASGLKWITPTLCLDVSAKMSDQANNDTEYLKKARVASYMSQFDDALSNCGPDTKVRRLNSSSSSISEANVKFKSLYKGKAVEQYLFSSICTRRL